MKEEKAQEIIDEVSKKKNSRRELRKLKREERKKNKKLKKSHRKKLKIKIKNPLDFDDKKAIKDFLSYICFFGILVNFSLWVIFKISFTFYSWIAWGLAIWIIENKFVGILRKMIKK